MSAETQQNVCEGSDGQAPSSQISKSQRKKIARLEHMLEKGQQTIVEQPKPRTEEQIAEAKRKKKERYRAKAKAAAIAKRNAENDRIFEEKMAQKSAPTPEDKKTPEEIAEDKKIDDLICDEARKVWKFIGNNATHISLKMKWKSMSDEEKLQLVDLGFGEFTKKYPIVAKMMTILEKYSEKAFRRFLGLCRTNKPNITPTDARDKSAKENAKKKAQDIWCQNNAWYLVYLWEVYAALDKKKKMQTGEDPVTNARIKLDARMRKRVYTENYDLLMEEFRTIDEAKKNAEKEVVKMNAKTSSQAVNSMTNAIKHGSHTTMTEFGKSELRDTLKNLKDKIAEIKKKKMEEANPIQIPKSDPA